MFLFHFILIQYSSEFIAGVMSRKIFSLTLHVHKNVHSNLKMYKLYLFIRCYLSIATIHLCPN